MSSRKEPMTHPFTFFLTEWINITAHEAHLSQQTQSLDALYEIAISLDEKGQEALKDDIQRMEKIYDGQVVLTTDIYRELRKTIMKHLHKEGYFIAAKFGPQTRTSTMEDMKHRIDKAKYGHNEKEEKVNV